MSRAALHRLSVPSPTLGEDVAALALVAGSGPETTWVWLLHGNGSSAAGMRPLLDAVGSAVGAGALGPHVVVALDGPWLQRRGWWADSSVRRVGRVGAPVESALLADVLPAVEARLALRPVPRAQRLVAGVSMGGAAALRWALVHGDLFAGAALLSPAAYPDQPPDGSSARTSGAFGVADRIFVPDRFAARAGWAALLRGRDPAGTRSTVATSVGDGEPPQWLGGEPMALDLAAVRLHAALDARPDVASSLQVAAGGHDMALWSSVVVDTIARAGSGAAG